MSSDLASLRKKVLKKFSCQKCAQCCQRDQGYVYVTGQEIENIAKFLKMDAWLFKQKYVSRSGGWYILSSDEFRKGCFLDENNICQIYPARPKYCRDYPNCEDVWQNKKSLQEECFLCPELKKLLKNQ
ncbi:YkgJ family cysteine cluster protein [Candidatus Margulisiibacteriota bacterium]